MSHRVKMDRRKRAKQFMPFSALKGYEEALRAVEKEKEAIGLKELQEDSKEILDRKLYQLKEGKQAAAVFFKEGKYQRQVGIVKRIDRESEILQVEEEKIPFQNLYNIEEFDTGWFD